MCGCVVVMENLRDGSAKTERGSEDSKPLPGMAMARGAAARGGAGSFARTSHRWAHSALAPQ